MLHGASARLTPNGSFFTKTQRCDESTTAHAPPLPRGQAVSGDRIGLPVHSSSTAERPTGRSVAGCVCRQPHQLLLMSNTDTGTSPVWKSRETAIALLAIAMIAIHLVLGFATPRSDVIRYLPLWCVLVFGGIPLVWDLLGKLLRREFGSDLLAGISIVVSAILGEYLAGSLVVLMLSGGEALEAYAVRSASSVLQALSRRMPSVAHRKTDSVVDDVPLDQVDIGDILAVFPHEICPVDGLVEEGHGVMDESYLTGEPYMMSKTPGSEVLSGAINGDSALIIRATRRAVDSRYARIMQVMRESEQHRPRMRRLADRLGAWYTPLAIAIGVAAWVASGDPGPLSGCDGRRHSLSTADCHPGRHHRFHFPGSTQGDHRP